MRTVILRQRSSNNGVIQAFRMATQTFESNRNLCKIQSAYSEQPNCPLGNVSNVQTGVYLNN